MDDSQLRAMLTELEHWEGRESRLYLDSRGNATIGVGCLVPGPSYLSCLPMRVRPSGRLATDAEARTEYCRVTSMPPNLGARAYRAKPPEPELYLTEEGIDGLAFRRLHIALAGLRKLCPGFDGFPAPAQMCLCELAWNLGVGKLGSEFPKLLAACNSDPPDWRTAALESHVSSSRDARNEWRAQMMFEAARGG